MPGLESHGLPGTAQADHSAHGLTGLCLNHEPGHLSNPWTERVSPAPCLWCIYRKTPGRGHVGPRVCVQNDSGMTRPLSRLQPSTSKQGPCPVYSVKWGPRQSQGHFLTGLELSLSICADSLTFSFSLFVLLVFFFLTPRSSFYITALETKCTAHCAF